MDANTGTEKRSGIWNDGNKSETLDTTHTVLTFLTHLETWITFCGKLLSDGKGQFTKKSK